MLGSDTSVIEAKQLYHLQLDGATCEIVFPDKHLSEVIDYYWFLKITATTLDLEVIPDTALDLVLCPDIKGFSALYFPVTQKFSIPLQGPIHYAGVCFKVAEAPDFLGYELRQLRGFSNGAETINALGIQSLVSDIGAIESSSACGRVFDAFWLEYVASSRERHSTKNRIDYRKMLEVLEKSMGESSISNICQSLNVSERQFRRCFNELFGISPKKMQGVLRLQATLVDLFGSNPVQLKDLYFDDSHRIRELKKLTGLTPKEIRQMAEKYNSE